MIWMRGDVAMVLFRRELGPVERFERALGDKQAARQKLAGRLSIAEAALEAKRAAIERLAAAAAAAIQLDRAEARMRAVEVRAGKLRAAVAECDEQIAATERALADARVQRDRDRAADEIEAMAAAIERAVPEFGAGAAALMQAVTDSPASVPAATRFSASVDAVRREVLSAADLACWELRFAAAQTRAGNANMTRAPEPMVRERGGWAEPTGPAFGRPDEGLRDSHGVVPEDWADDVSHCEADLGERR
jgi:hypothetical protein